MFYRNQKLGPFALACVLCFFGIRSLDGIKLKEFGFEDVQVFLGPDVTKKIKNFSKYSDGIEEWRRGLNIYARPDMKVLYEGNLLGILYLCTVGANQINDKNYLELAPDIYSHIKVFSIKKNEEKLTHRQKKLYVWVLKKLVPYTACFFNDLKSLPPSMPPVSTPAEMPKVPLSPGLSECAWSSPDIPPADAESPRPRAITLPVEKNQGVGSGEYILGD